MKPRRMSVARIAGLAMGLVLVIGSGGITVAGAADSDPAVIYRGVSTAVQFDVSPPLTELAQRQPTVESFRERDRDNDRPSGLEGPLGPQDFDALVQHEVGSGEIPAPSISFDAFDNNGGNPPPDPVGAVGPNHYVVMANVRFAVYSKTGTLLAGPANINTLWSGFGGPCQNENRGDPIVLYDRQADRWLVTQLTAAGPEFFNCVALSQTADPTGTYYRWAFSTGMNFPDYPKYGHWPDAYYISTREIGVSGFVGIGAYALNRVQMLAGNPTPQVISFLATPGAMPYRVGDGLLPADLDGSTLPPAGTPNFYIGSQDNGGPYGGPFDALNIWAFHVDFVTPANSTFTLANTVAVGAFDSMFSPCTGFQERECIPQPGTFQKIDHLGYRQRPLHRAAYRNFGTHESIVTNQSVEASAGISGVRWWEIRSPNSSPTIFQQGTYAPGVTDGIHRWMGSIAQDQQGNMALGFSASNTSVFPSSWYTGRLVGDALGTMGQGEGSFINGLGSQTGSARWGDYTSMNVDPVDDCTFWYVNQYYPSTSPSGWRLRVGAFKYPSCSELVALQVTSPNGGENWAAGSVHPITWTSSSLDPSGTLYLYYLYNGTWVQIASVAPGTTAYAWTVPNTPTTSAAVWICNWVTSACQVADQSNGPFTISSNGVVPPPPALQVTSPNGGENWAAGSVHPITWTSSSLDPSGTLYLFYISNGSPVQIATVAPGTTAYAWTVPNTPTTSAAVWICNWVNAACQVADQSDQPFTISTGGGAGSQLLLNPGFESGNVNWVTTAGVINNSGRPPHGGSWFAWLDGYGQTHTDSCYQQITIPASATSATLTFYLSIDTAETTTTTAFDRLQVQIRNSSNTVLATLATYSNLNKTTGYELKSFNLTAYKGQTIRIYFLGTEDSILQTSFVIDDTAVNVN